MKIVKFFAFFLFLLQCQNVFCLQHIFYIKHNKNIAGINDQRIAFNSLKNNYTLIDLLITQAYTINARGNMKGYINTNVYQFAKQHQMKLMVLITNAGFDPNIAHAFLSNNIAQQVAINEILRLCQQYQFDGVQFDFEAMSYKDKEAYTRFIQTAAKKLHQFGFKISIAVVPNVTNLDTAFLKRRFQNWAGVYDLPKLSQAVDFITLMSYDQHTDGTTPGPIASLSWVQETLNYTLKFISADKLALGIPTYSGYWYTSEFAATDHMPIIVRMDTLSFDDVQKLKAKQLFNLQWDDKNKFHYAIYEHHWLYKYIFVEDAASFKAKLDLAKLYHLFGIAVFSLGFEDKAIWDVLKNSDS